ncbi:MAG: hypothetical protein EP343_04995 [Deltaproteobacteria bacterium]|nr:MAG: hypothetical protein EP343_04995 [Deltaproteobacteria bacterium]
MMQPFMAWSWRAGVGWVLYMVLASSAWAASTRPAPKASPTLSLTLEHPASVSVHATWSKITASSMRLETYPRYARFFRFCVAVPKRRYTRRDLRVFLPPHPVRVGEIWQVPEQKLRAFFLQFHPRAMMHMHDGGPRGAYAMVRAVSEEYAEVVVRVHVQFLLAPRIFFTPAQFRGRLLIHRKTNTLASFQLAVPTERTRNIDLNVDNLVDAVFVPTMALRATLPPVKKQPVWRQHVPDERVERLLGQKFYAFLQIQWKSVKEALRLARKRKKPIHVFTVFGSLDDQSC